MSNRRKIPKVVLEGTLWGGYKTENDLRYPYYILPDEIHTFEKDEIFVADKLSKFARKRIRITIEEIDGPCPYWRVFPPRQITGKPFCFFGYIGRKKRERHCHNGNHRSEIAATRCSIRAAILANQEGAK